MVLFTIRSETSTKKESLMKTQKKELTVLIVKFVLRMIVFTLLVGVLLVFTPISYFYKMFGYTMTFSESLLIAFFIWGGITYIGYRNYIAKAK